MPETSCTHTLTTATNPITAAQPAGTLAPAPATGWATCLGPMRRFVQLRSRGRIGLLPSPPAP